MKILAEQETSRGGRFGSQGGGMARSSVSQDADFTDGGASTEVIFKVRLYKPMEIKGKATVSSTRGGILTEKEFIIK